MKVVYIAGPFRAKSYWKQEQNIRAAENLALEVWKLGAAVICPHTNTRFYQGECPDYVWLNGDMELVRRSDALMMVWGWQASTGARGEYELAKSLDKPIFESTAALKNWLDDAAAERLS